ncbi:MAG: hypothetical protein HY287_14940 [Planctomycetes bacterium]|nr:hypothetical protein [Planctomycetota bacterium]MBI3835620.1 hypothetical protein [Planctomycetota bacterium]
MGLFWSSGRAAADDVFAWQSVSELYAPMPAPADYFGNAVALSSDFALVGAWLADPAGPSSGSVFIFRRGDADGNTWVYHGQLAPSDGALGDQFGYSVAINGDYAVVGAWKATTPRAIAAGAAYIYRRDDRGTPDNLADDVWVQSGKLTASNGSVGNNFGTSVAIRDPYIIVGAPNWASYGEACVFVRDDRGTPVDPSDDQWTQRALLGPTRRLDVPYHHFGVAVAIAQDHILVGADEEQVASSRPGSAYVYVRNDGETPANPLDDTWTEQSFLTAGDSADYQSFGHAVALTDDLAVIGAPSPYGFTSQRTYVFERRDGGTPAIPSDDQWIQTSELAPTDPSTKEGFGNTVALAGGAIAVGASWADSDSVTRSGVVYVFQNINSVWQQEARLTAPTPRFGDGLGRSVALDGNTLLAGAWADDDRALASGAAQLFHLAPANKTLMAGAPTDFSNHVAAANCSVTRLEGADISEYDRFGKAVGVAGDLVYVAADQKTVEQSFGAGAVYVYESSDLTSPTKITASDATRYGGFGSSLSAEDDRILVGANSKAYVLRKMDESWIEEQRWTSAQYGNGFGSSVSLRNRVAAIGGLQAAHVFRLASGVWNHETALIPGDLGAYDQYGTAISTDGARVAVGASYQDSPDKDAGAVYVFRFDGNSWTRETKLLGHTAFEQFGKSVSIDGEWCAIGTWAASDAGPWSGAVYIYRFDGNGWSLQDRITPLGSSAGDDFGYAVALRGENLLVGAPADDATACDGGAVYRFRWDGQHWSQAARIAADDALNSSAFGYSVALDGDNAAAGAVFDRSVARNGGAAYLIPQVTNCRSNDTSDECAHAIGDHIVYAYEGDRLPYDEAGGWEGMPCENSCIESVENGNLVLRWFSYGGDAQYFRTFVNSPSDLPESLWIEWRLRSNHPVPCCSISCDTEVSILYDEIEELVDCYGDFAGTPAFNGSISGLDLDQFHTFRFESTDGSHYTLSADGTIFITGVDQGYIAYDYLQFYAHSGCPTVPLPLKIDELDYIRYGSIGSGEAIVSTDPPAGILGSSLNPNLNQFRVTFDNPNYVYINDVSVQVSSGTAPKVIKTRRQDNGPPETVEIVLDRALQLGVTTTFTFATGGSPNTVTYTLVQTGACCQSDGTCTQSTDTDCAAAGGSFSADGSCSTPTGCCLSGGTCRNLTEACCSLAGGTSTSNGLCEGDADHDGVDGMCGDICPYDPDNDIDGDGLCGDVDPCPTLNPNDANHNGIPDCQEPTPIPTTNQWGLTILALALFIAGKIYLPRRIRI